MVLLPVIVNMDLSLRGSSFGKIILVTCDIFFNHEFAAAGQTNSTDQFITMLPIVTKRPNIAFVFTKSDK